MPGKVKVKILAGRNLPVMDRSSDTTDAYVEIKLGNTTYKTDVCRKSLHPCWDSDWYRFEVDDSELQDEPLQIRLMDHDTYSANDAIGKVYLDLNPLLLPAASLLKSNGEALHNHEHVPNPVMSGWIPVYDTMHGIRGEVNVTVKVELFTDFNKFRQSSCGVQFFYSPVIPQGFYAQVVHGFVEELVVNDDPEYQWIDKIRTPRASNEARQTLFFKLSGELQRKIGVKALDLGGNAVVGYNQSFDLEGDSGIVARGIGTAVTLVKMVDTSVQNVNDQQFEERAISYLKFLSSSKGFRLNKKPHSLKFNKFFPSLSPVLSSSLTLKPPDDITFHSDYDHPSRMFTRHLSHTDFSQMVKPTMQHSTSLQTLLKQEDMRGTPGSGISQRIKNLKYSSQSILSKKMTALKAKLSDTPTTEEVIETNPVDCLEIKKKKRKFCRTVSDSNTMAELLVRSVIHAHNSLECIIEAHDSHPVFQKQISLNETSSGNDEQLHSTAESCLSLPDTTMDTHSSNASESSDSSSSDGEVSDTKDNRIDFDTVSDIVKNVRKLSMLNNIETAEKIFLQNVAILDKQEECDSNDEIDEASSKVDSELYRCNFGENAKKKINDIKPEPQIVVNTKNLEDKCVSTEAKQWTFHACVTGKQLEENCDKKVHEDDEIKLKDADMENEDAETKVQNYNMKPEEVNIKFLVGEREDNKFIPPMAELDDFSIQSSDEEGFLNDTAMNNYEYDTNISHNESINTPKSIESLSETKPVFDDLTVPCSNNIDRKLIIPPVMIGANIENQGLIQTAMQTILLDKVNIIGTYTPPTSPGATTKTQTFVLPQKHTPQSPEKDQSFFPQITKAFEFIRRSSTPSGTSEYDKKTGLGAKCLSLHNISSNLDGSRAGYRKFSLEHKHESVLGKPFTALRNKNIDRVQKSCSVANSPDEREHKFKFTSLDNIHIKTTKHHSFLTKAENKIKSVFHAPFALLHHMHENQKKKSEEKQIPHTAMKHEHGLLGTALENVLMESVNDILATSHTDGTTGKVDAEANIQLSQDVAQASYVTETELLPVDVTILQAENEVLPLLSNSQNLITINKSPDKNIAPIVPANTEIDIGINNANKMHAGLHPSLRSMGSPIPDYNRQEHGHQRTESMGAKILHSPAKLNAMSCIHRRSSDSDLSITPKGNSLTGSDRSGGGFGGGHFVRNSAFRSTLPPENFDIMEYPFLTMSKYPPGFVAYLGGAISARSVKLLERITNIDEPESRDTWWSEIRMEIRSHARALNCNAVLGYSETTSICDDVCVLSACGTAAIIGFQYPGEINDSLGGLPIIPKAHLMGRGEIMSSSLDRSDFDRDRRTEAFVNNQNSARVLSESPEREPGVSTATPHLNNSQNCTMCHLPYNGGAITRTTVLSKCAVCRTGKVPEILLATIEMPDGIPCIGRGCFLQSYVCRSLKDLKGESNAKEISDGLPFLEYELHRILVNKLKIKGMNAIFGLKVRISIGDKILIGIATGTAVFLSALPSPPIAKLVSDRSTDEKKLAELQKKLHEVVRQNKEIYQLKQVDTDHCRSDTDESEDEQTVLDLSLGNKDSLILEVDDPDDVEILNLLMEPRPPDGFHVVNTELVPGLEELEIVKNLQMFIQIWRSKIVSPYNLDKHFHRLLDTVYFKLRRMIPCALCDLQFRVDSPESDEIQLYVLGMALGLGDPQKNPKLKRKPKRNDDELIFNLEEDQIPENSVVQTTTNVNFLHTQISKYRQKSPQRNRITMRQRHVPYRERHGVDITPLSYVPGGKIERYLGNLNFFFIRETTSIREVGGLSGFVHGFVTEVLAIVRAHVTALGGNAMVAYFMTECVLNTHSLHKNQVSAFLYTYLIWLLQL